MRRLVPLLALLLLAGPARAAVDTTSILCPVDGEEVPVTVLLSSDSLLGHDRDLCPHAAGDDEVRSAVSSCPRCGFAGTPAEFRGELPDEIAERVKHELKPAGSAWERYANRARILQWEGAPEAKVGESWLRAAWSVRLDPRPLGEPALEEAAHRILAVAPSGAADPILDPARAIEKALESKAPRKDGALIREGDRALAFYLVGSLWRQRGELDAAEVRYARALSEGKEGERGERPGSIPGLVARDRSTIALERDYLKRALEDFRAALSAGSPLPDSQRAMLVFQAAEAARRIGEKEEAARYYRMTEGLSEDPAVRPLVKQGLEETLGAGKAK